MSLAEPICNFLLSHPIDDADDAADDYDSDAAADDDD